MIQNINSVYFNFLCSGWHMNFLSLSSKEFCAFTNSLGNGTKTWPSRNPASSVMVLSIVCIAQNSFLARKPFVY